MHAAYYMHHFSSAEWFQNDACNYLKEKRQNTCGISVEYTISKCVESTLSYMMCSLSFKSWISELVNYQFDKSICYTVGILSYEHVTTCLWPQVAWNLFLEYLVYLREFNQCTKGTLWFREKSYEFRVTATYFWSIGIKTGPRTGEIRLLNRFFISE